MLGYNDILSSGIDKTLANYKTLISRIKTKKPNTKFYIINVAYMYEGTETKEINKWSYITQKSFCILKKTIHSLMDTLFPYLGSCK